MCVGLGLAHSRAHLTIHTTAADYLIVITKRTKVATVFTTPIYAANDFSVFPLERSSSAELVKHPQEAYLLGLIKSHLYSAPFYFTYGGYNVTSRLQEQEPSEKPLWETVCAIGGSGCERSLTDGSRSGGRPILLEPPPPATLNRRNHLGRSGRRECERETGQRAQQRSTS